MKGQGKKAHLQHKTETNEGARHTSVGKEFLLPFTDMTAPLPMSLTYNSLNPPLIIVKECRGGALVPTQKGPLLLVLDHCLATTQAYLASRSQVFQVRVWCCFWPVDQNLLQREDQFLSQWGLPMKTPQLLSLAENNLIDQCFSSEQCQMVWSYSWNWSHCVQWKLIPKASMHATWSSGVFVTVYYGHKTE